VGWQGEGFRCRNQTSPSGGKTARIDNSGATRDTKGKRRKLVDGTQHRKEIRKLCCRRERDIQKRQEEGNGKGKWGGEYL